MRHMFSIKALDRLPGLFGPRRYLYYCARCKWSFIVNDGRRGVLTPIADNGTPLEPDEAVARAATFALGPCPAMRALSDAAVNVHANGNGSNGHAAAHVENSRRPEPISHQLHH
jgi:hypothetical protein